jgi:glutamate---cysteine ligase / carboxylate-amine ligase
MTSYPPTADELRAAFDAPSPCTVGLEEELMLLDPETHDLALCAQQVLELMGEDQRFKLELPAAQFEIVLPPRRTVGEAVRGLAAARRTLSEAVAGLARPAAAGVHPFAEPAGEINRGKRYERTLAEYATVARRQLVCALQIHVAVGGAERTLAVYNALRPHLPELAALAANAPFHAGEDTGLASVRPTIAETLPRQGVPPAISTWQEYAEALRGGHAAGAVPEPRRWWWELRPHPGFGTLELRVPDAQTTIEAAGGVAALAQSLVAWMSARHDAGEDLPGAPTWRIEENRWSAARHGVEGTMANLRTGERRSTRERLTELIETLAPVARLLGCEGELETARDLAKANGAMRQREVGAELGLHGLAEWLGDRYLSGVPERRTAGVTGPTGG